MAELEISYSRPLSPGIPVLNPKKKHTQIWDKRCPLDGGTSDYKMESLTMKRVSCLRECHSPCMLNNSRT